MGAGEVGGQALSRGLIDHVAIDIVPVDFGRGKPYFGTLADGHLMLEDPEVVRCGAELLPPEPWSEDVWQQWTKIVAEKTGAKGRTLFHPLRLALTGVEHGPELKKLLPLIGRARALARLNGETA